MNKKKIASVGGVLSAVLASTCCIGPVILTGLGVGTGGISFIRGLGRFHILFMVLTFLLIGAAFYFTYKKNCQPDKGIGCCSENNKKNKTILWISTIVTAILLMLPYII